MVELQAVNETPDSFVEAKELEAKLVSTLDNCSPIVRWMLNLRFKRGLTYGEIGSRFGVTESEAESTIQEALEELNDKLRLQGVVPSMIEA